MTRLGDVQQPLLRNRPQDLVLTRDLLLPDRKGPGLDGQGSGWVPMELERARLMGEGPWGRAGDPGDTAGRAWGTAGGDAGVLGWAAG